MAVPAPTALCQFLSSAGVTTSGAVPVGSIVPVGTFVKVTCWGATASTTFGVSDSKGNTWSSLAQVGNTGGSALVVKQEFYTTLTVAWTATDTITATRTTANALGFFANTYGVGLVGSVGTQLTNNVTANNAAVTFGSSLTPGAGDLVEVQVAWSNATAGTVGSGYTKPLDAATTVTNARRCAIEYQAFPSGGTTSPTFTCGGSPQWAATAVQLVAAASTYPAAGEVDAVSGTAGTITAILAATALVAGVSGATAAVTATYPTSGTVAATSGTAATVGRTQPVSGTVAATSGVSVTATANHPVTGTVAATSGVSLDAPATHPVSGAVAAVSAAHLTADLPGVAGTVVAVSGSSLTVNANHPVTGTVAAVSGASLTATARLVASGTTAATSGVAATITGRYAVGGTVVVVSAVSLDARIYIPPRNVTTTVTGHQRTITATEHDRTLTAAEHQATITATDRS